MEDKYIVVIVIVIIAVTGIGYILTTEFLTDEDNNMPQDPMQEAINTIDTDKDINIDNKYNQTETVKLKVERNNTGEVVHEEEYELEPDSSLDPAYTLSVNRTETIPSFTVTSTVGNQTESVNVRMSQCYGSAYVEVQSDGNLYAFYSIC